MVVFAEVVNLIAYVLRHFGPLKPIINCYKAIRKQTKSGGFVASLICQFLQSIQIVGFRQLHLQDLTGSIEIKSVKKRIDALACPKLLMFQINQPCPGWYWGEHNTAVPLPGWSPDKNWIVPTRGL